MIRSKNIADYFEAKLSDIRPWVILEFQIHLYFAQNQHMVILCPEGEAPSDDFLQKYRSKGLEKIWIHNNDKVAFQHYQSCRTQEGAVLAALLKSAGNEAEEEQKKIIVAAAAQELVNKLGSAKTPQEQAAENEKMKLVIRDVLDQTAIRSESAVADLLNLCDADPKLTHAVNVATYAATFALAFGKIQPDLISDIALAGLLHDIGLSQIPLRTLSTPQIDMDRETLEEYFHHIQVSLGFIEQFAHKIPERVKILIEQHHEKFDGTGYPNRISGKKFNDISQLLAMADRIDSVSSGRWDGKKHTLKETLKIIGEQENAGRQPEFFHPALLKAVLAWVCDKEADETLSKVIDTVQKQAQSILVSEA